MCSCMASIRGAWKKCRNVNTGLRRVKTRCAREMSWYHDVRPRFKRASSGFQNAKHSFVFSRCGALQRMLQHALQHMVPRALQHALQRALQRVLQHTLQHMLQHGHYPKRDAHSRIRQVCATHCNTHCNTYCNTLCNTQCNT